MSGRGEQIFGLATPQAQRQVPSILTRKPLSFGGRMDNTQTFLKSLRSPEDNHEVEATEKDSTDMTTPMVDEADKENVPRRSQVKFRSR